MGGVAGGVPQGERRGVLEGVSGDGRKDDDLYDSLVLPP